MESIKHLAIDTPESSAAFKRRFMWRLLAVLIGGMLLDGYILGVIGPVTTPMKKTWACRHGNWAWSRRPHCSAS